MKIKITKIFEPVKDKPGYYWLNKRNYTIISKEVLEEAFKKKLEMSKEDKDEE